MLSRSLVLYAATILVIWAGAAAPSVAKDRYYPEAAMRQRVEGVATIRCDVTADNRLANCVVVSEDPPGMGFGEAALRMAPLFKMKPNTEGLSADGATATIPIRFKLPN